MSINTRVKKQIIDDVSLQLVDEDENEIIKINDEDIFS